MEAMDSCEPRSSRTHRRSVGDLPRRFPLGRLPRKRTPIGTRTTDGRSSEPFSNAATRSTHRRFSGGCACGSVELIETAEFGGVRVRHYRLHVRRPSSDLLGYNVTTGDYEVASLAMSGQLPQMTHPDNRIRMLLQDCPFLIDRVDLSEGSYSIMAEIAASLRHGRFSDAKPHACSLT
jgi:hypothetical protein